MRDLFGVALVHLAAISLDEEFRHGGARTIHGEQSSSKTQHRDFDQRTSLHCHVERKRNISGITLFAKSKMI